MKGGMLIPSLDWVEVETEQCEMCGLWFSGGATHLDKEAHYMRCMERKIAEHRERTGKGQRRVAKGWLYSDNILAG